MDKMVVDASAVLAVLLRETHREAVIAASAGAELVSPDSLPFEVANALSARMKRRDEQRLAEPEAVAAFGQFQRMKITLVPQTMRDHEQALALAGRLGMYSYDAYLLVCAQVQQARLLTLDGIGRMLGLRQHAQRLGITLVNTE